LVRKMPETLEELREEAQLFPCYGSIGVCWVAC